MADIAHAHSDEHHYTATGIDSRKLAIWTFIGSECMFFASLIGCFLFANATIVELKKAD